ncbi:MAG TPA: selenocysteine-specific translation elongation factor [Pyrinomonadaceae bacterium]|nr:selenocysteine-specific translation elongation factor [Pyrinomonadaceae bacterium]
MDIIVGTAGHIDHGKTALVKALTGVDADRLPEEKQRGITIDLGFAEMLSDDVRVGFVDVPGHERFVKNMLAGASGIDLVLLVVAADEGVMPQTREHFDICRLLRIKSGVIALTKADLADEETLDLAKLDVSELVQGSFLERSPVFSVSSKTRAGIEELRSGLIKAAKEIDRHAEIHEPRLAIDRSFSVKGFGAVVTGTLASGKIVEGEELELLPPRRALRVRGIQTHGDSVGASGTGQRTAVNLGGIGHDEIERGMVLTKAGSLAVTQILDAEVEVLAAAPRALRTRQRVRVHLGTSEVLARVSILNHDQAIEPGSWGFAQFRLESPVAAAHGDRFIVRSYSPQRTIAGGRVLDPVAHKHRRVDFENTASVLAELRKASDGNGNVAEIFVRTSGEKGLRIGDLRQRTALRHEVLKDLIATAVGGGLLIDASGVLITKDIFERLKKATLDAVEKYHRADKLARGLAKEILREAIFKHAEAEVFRAVTDSLERLGKVTIDQDVVKIPSHETELTPAEKAVYDGLNEIYANAGLEAPKLEDALSRVAVANGLDQRSARKIFQLFVDGGELVAVTAEYYFSRTALERLIGSLRDLAKSSGDATIDVAKFKEIAGVSRKYAIPLLEYFDRARVTRRVGDKRQIL